MFLLTLGALANQGASFVEPPHLREGAVTARVVIEDPAFPENAGGGLLKLVVDGKSRRTRAQRAIKDGVTTVLSFDGSGSFRRNQDSAFALAESYVENRLPKESIGVMVFGRKAEAWAPVADNESIEANLAEARDLGAVQQETRLAAFVREAVEAASAALPRSQGGVRRVIVFTDAGEESQVFDVEEVADFARARGVIVDAVVFARPGSGSYAEDLDRVVKLTHLSGGGVIEVHGADADPNSMADLVKRVRHLYDVGAPYCGEAPPKVSVRAPDGVHTDSLVATGQAKPCPESENGAVAPRPVDVSWAAPTGKLGGLLCLALAVLVLGLLGAVGWLLASRDEGDGPPSPPSKAPVAPSPKPKPPAATPMVPSKPVDESPVFSMNLPETHLRVVEGDLPGTTRWRFAGRILRVGASAEENDVVVDLPQISSRHARFELFPSGDVFIEDLGSSNGTWVGSVRLRPNIRTQIPLGMRVSLSSQLVLVVEQPHRGRA